MMHPHRSLEWAADFATTARNIPLHPRPFFARMPRSGNSLAPLLFALICISISSIISGILLKIGLASDASIYPGMGSFPLDPRESTLAWILLVVLYISVGTLSIFPIAGMLHLLIRWLASRQAEGFEATFRVIAYSSVVDLLTWIPHVGLLFGLYGFYLWLVGIREVHGTAGASAILIVLLSFIAWIALVTALIVFLSFWWKIALLVFGLIALMFIAAVVAMRLAARLIS